MAKKGQAYYLLANAYRQAYDRHEELMQESEEVVKKMNAADGTRKDLEAALERLGYSIEEAYTDGVED